MTDKQAQYYLMDPDVDARKRMRCWLTLATGILVDLTGLTPENRARVRRDGAKQINGLSAEAAEEILASFEGYITAPWSE